MASWLAADEARLAADEPTWEALVAEQPAKARRLCQHEDFLRSTCKTAADVAEAVLLMLPPDVGAPGAKRARGEDPDDDVRSVWNLRDQRDPKR